MQFICGGGKMLISTLHFPAHFIEVAEYISQVDKLCAACHMSDQVHVLSLKLGTF